MSNTDFGNPDVIVVGAGNAASCAALALREKGASVIMLEAAPVEDSGGNSRYTAGLMRHAFHGVDDLVQIIPELTEEERKEVDFGTYPESQFFDDMGNITKYRTDPDLCELLVTKSLETLIWMRKNGIRFQPSFGRQAYKVDGKYKFWGVPSETWGGGMGLVDSEHKLCMERGVKIFYETPAVALITNDDDAVCGVEVKHKGKRIAIRARAVVLACGGFESNAEMRARYLGPNWDLAKVRGTRYNTGAGIKMALEAGAVPYGHWSGAHACEWDLNAPPYGDVTVGDNFQKHCYPLGIVVNERGERFIDEGADFRGFTYAKYGREILAQPNMFAWQIFDSKFLHMLRDEYRIKRVTKVTANTLEELVKKLDGVDADACLREIHAFNKAVRTDVPFNPAVLDGRSAPGLRVPRNNWANTIDKPPFEAYAVTCGVTFTFGGVKVTVNGEVEDTSGKPIPGLFAAGEMVGGLFYHNYPAGTGLTSGAVFGRIAGNGAAGFVGR